VVFAKLYLYIAAPCYLFCIVYGFRYVVKYLLHFLRRLHIELSALVLHPVFIIYILLSLNADKYVMSLGILFIEIMAVIGGYKRNTCLR